MFYYRLILGVWCLLFFFFKQKTAYEMRISDWSSDVCSSDLPAAEHVAGPQPVRTRHRDDLDRQPDRILPALAGGESIHDHLGVVDDHLAFGRLPIGQIARASCRESVCQYV